MYQIAADLHTHTLVSNHAFNTITEMAAKAASMGYKAIAVTDHGCAMPDSPHIWYFNNLVRLPDVLEGIPVLKGVEANVMDLNGTLDFSQEQLAQFDWVIASIHGDCLPGKLTVEQATELWLNVAKNPYVDMIGHSEQANHVYDYERVTREFAAYNKVVELNGNSFSVRPQGAANMRALALACKKSGCKIALNSDAHSIYHLERGVSHLYTILEEINFPQELIINGSGENLRRELEIHNKKIVDRIGELLR